MDNLIFLGCFQHGLLLLAVQICIINAPSFFSMIWKLVKNFIPEATLQKVLPPGCHRHAADCLRTRRPERPRFCCTLVQIRIGRAGKETTEALTSLIDPKDIPVEVRVQGSSKRGSRPGSLPTCSNAPGHKLGRSHVCLMLRVLRMLGVAQYGGLYRVGEGEWTARFRSEQEIMFRDFVHDLNRRNGLDPPYERSHGNNKPLVA